MSLELRVLSTDQIRPNTGDRLTVGPVAFTNYTTTTRPYEESGVNILDATQSTSTSTGALTTLGGASSEKDVWVGGTAACVGDAHSTGDAVVGRSVRSTGPISCASASVGGMLTCGGSLEVGDQVECTGVLRTNSTVTAALSVTAGVLSLPTHDVTFATLDTGSTRSVLADVSGAISVAGDAHVGAATTVVGDLTATAASNTTSVVVNDTTQCTTAGTGSVIAGSTSVGDGLGVAGNLTVDGKATVAALTVPNGGMGVAGHATFANAELASTATLYRSVQSRIWGTEGTRGVAATYWFAFKLRNNGMYLVQGSVAIPASCRPGGPLKLRMISCGTFPEGTAQLSYMVQVIRPGGPVPSSPTQFTNIQYPFLVGNQSLTFWEGTAPATAEEMRNTVLKWVVVRTNDFSGGTINVTNVELMYVHESWGVHAS